MLRAARTLKYQCRCRQSEDVSTHHSFARGGGLASGLGGDGGRARGAESPAPASLTAASLCRLWSRTLGNSAVDRRVLRNQITGIRKRLLRPRQAARPRCAWRTGAAPASRCATGRASAGRRASAASRSSTPRCRCRPRRGLPVLDYGSAPPTALPAAGGRGRRRGRRRGRCAARKNSTATGPVYTRRREKKPSCHRMFFRTEVHVEL